VPRLRRTRRPRGQGSVYEKRPGQFIVRWSEDGVRRTSDRTYPSREIAEKVRIRVAHDRLLESAGLPPDEASIPALGYFGDEWIERHKTLHRSSGDDASRWRCHVRPAFGALRPAAVDHGAIRAFVEEKLAEGLDPATVGHCVKLLSRIYGDLLERPRETGVSANPVRSLPRSTRRLYKPRHDPKTVPYVESMDEVRALEAALPEPFSTMYAVGIYALLRPGEILGLFSEDVDVPGRRIQVRRQVQYGRIGPLKDDEARVVPIVDALLPRLQAQKLRVGSAGPLFPTTRKNGGGNKRSPSRFVSINTLHDRFASACEAVGREDIQEWTMPWYQSTRHTGASHWVASGGNLATLSLLMGHAMTVVTERYAHLRPDLFSAADLARFSAPAGSPMAPGGPAKGQRKRQNQK
jgi:integrase